MNDPNLTGPPEPHLACAVVWSDRDLLEIFVRVIFGGWAGAESAYLTREEAKAFADDLDRVVKGETTARLDAGQSDLSWVRLEVFEYGLARRLALRVALGRAEGTMMNRPPERTQRELRIVVPVERGQLKGFSRALRGAVSKERGSTYVPLLREWPD